MKKKNSLYPPILTSLQIKAIKALNRGALTCTIKQKDAVNWEIDCLKKSSTKNSAISAHSIPIPQNRSRQCWIATIPCTTNTQFSRFTEGNKPGNSIVTTKQKSKPGTTTIKIQYNKAGRSARFRSLLHRIPRILSDSTGKMSETSSQYD